MLMKSSVHVPFFDWGALWAEHAEEFQRIIAETASRGAFILCEAVEEFEAALARYLGVKHVIGTSDCTNAMLLGLRASNHNPAAEIILPGHAFIAAAQSIHFAGGVPVPVDMQEMDGLIDPDAIRQAITARTRAIMPVHVNGRVCAMGPILELAREYGLEVYEDAAQALGAALGGRRAGTFGTWAAFSFYPSKTLGCFGDAGALATNDDELASSVRAMRNHGAGPGKAISADCGIWGTNARLDNLQAAILSFKLARYGEAVERRRHIARKYDEALRDLQFLVLPPSPAGADRLDIFQNYEIRCERRDDLRSHLAGTGIGTIVQWGGTPLHRFRKLGFAQDLPRTDAYFQQCLLLPMNHLLSDREVEQVIGAVRSFAG